MSREKSISKRHCEFESGLRQTLGKYFERKGYEIEKGKPYRLNLRKSKKDEDQLRNIIRCDVRKYIARIKKEHEENPDKGLFLHPKFHYGTSSQAMLFNLMGPLIVKNDFLPLHKVLLKSMKGADIDWLTREVRAEFEYEDRKVLNEFSKNPKKPEQPTAIDLVVSSSETKTGSIFIEAKLRENGFSGCSQIKDGKCYEKGKENPFSQGFNVCYLHHYRKRNYWETMDKLGFRKTGLTSSEDCPIAKGYQFFREVLFALEQGGYFILIHDERNPYFCETSIDGKGAETSWSFLTQFVPQEHKDKIGKITIQQLANAIEDSGNHDWIGEFKQKYGIE